MVIDAIKIRASLDQIFKIFCSILLREIRITLNLYDASRQIREHLLEIQGFKFSVLASKQRQIRCLFLNNLKYRLSLIIYVYIYTRREKMVHFWKSIYSNTVSI